MTTETAPTRTARRSRQAVTDEVARRPGRVPPPGATAAIIEVKDIGKSYGS